VFFKLNIQHSTFNNQCSSGTTLLNLMTLPRGTIGG